MNEPAKKRTLNDILEAYQELMWHIEDLDGEVTDDIGEELHACEAEFSDKVNGCLMVREKFIAQAEVYAKRAKALGDHAKRLKARAEWLKEYVFHGMEHMKIAKLDNLRDFAFAQVRNTAPKVEIADEVTFIRRHADSVFVEYRPHIDKTQIKEALKAEMPVEGARLVQGRALYVK